MCLSLEELVRWLGLTVFEIWLHLVSIFIFSILLVLRLDPLTGWGGSLAPSQPLVSWTTVFIPLFCADCFAAYFSVIVYVRAFRTGNRRQPLLRMLSGLVLLLCIFVSELLLTQKLSGEHEYSYSEAFASLFVVQQVLMVRACQTR